MASSPDNTKQLFDQLGGPYRTLMNIQMLSGSARTTIPSDIRKHTDISVDDDDYEVDAYWFEDHEKLVIDLEGVGNE